MPERSSERKTVHPQLEVIAGPMFSGKTDELIRRFDREQRARLDVQIFKPIIDTRYGNLPEVRSHSGATFPATLVDQQKPESIIELLKPGVQVVGIEEIQFFSDGIVKVCDELVAMHKRVIVAGLPIDFRGEPFGSMPTLMVKAQKIDVMSAVCQVCGEEAYFTQRIKIIDDERIPVNYNDPIEVVGAAEMYEARCRTHHEVPGKPARK